MDNALAECPCDVHVVCLQQAAEQQWCLAVSIFAYEAFQKSTTTSQIHTVIAFAPKAILKACQSSAMPDAEDQPKQQSLR